MTDRDTFAAAALTGLMARPEINSYGIYDDPIDFEPVTHVAYLWADAMLRERARAGQKMAESDSFCAACPERESTNHDAAPAARAEDVLKEPNGSSTGELGGEPESKVRTGKQPAPPCVETDGLSPGSRTGQINRTPERQSPDRECEESPLRDVPQQDNCRAAGGPEHHISKAEIDAIQHVVEDGRLVDLADYGCLRSLLVRLRPEWGDEESDRSKRLNDDRLAALEELSALDQELELKHGIKGNPMIKAQQRTQHQHATPPQGSVQGERDFRDSRNAKEPVAWAVLATGIGSITPLAHDRKEAQQLAARLSDPHAKAVPLYRSPRPTLTDEEREAVEWIAETLSLTIGPERLVTLRDLLERLHT